MKINLEGRLVKFQPKPDDISEGTVTFKVSNLRPIDYELFARLYNQPADIEVDGMQRGFTPQKAADGTEQLVVDSAVDEGAVPLDEEGTDELGAGDVPSEGSGICQGCGGAVERPGALLCVFCAEEASAHMPAPSGRRRAKEVVTA